ncbi:hypothetical protein ACOSQ4_004772 [Xanthoceras sorbifolium]
MEVMSAQGEVVEASTSGLQEVKLPEGGFLETIKVAQKEKFAAKVKLEKKLAETANRCQAFRKEIKLEMNTSAARYSDQICVLKDKIERAKADLQHSYELLERQKKKDLATKDEELA